MKNIKQFKRGIAGLTVGMTAPTLIGLFLTKRTILLLTVQLGVWLFFFIVLYIYWSIPEKKLWEFDVEDANGHFGRVRGLGRTERQCMTAVYKELAYDVKAGLLKPDFKLTPRARKRPSAKADGFQAQYVQ